MNEKTSVNTGVIDCRTLLTDAVVYSNPMFWRRFGMKICTIARVANIGMSCV